MFASVRKVAIVFSSLVTLLSCALSAVADPIGYSVSSNGNDHLYRIELATGFATDLGLVGHDDAEGLAFANNILYAIDLYAIDGSEGGELWNITTAPGAFIGLTGPRGGADAGLDFDSRPGVREAKKGTSWHHC